MVPLVITLLQWEFVVTTMVFFSVEFKIIKKTSSLSKMISVGDITFFLILRTSTRKKSCLQFSTPTGLRSCGKNKGFT